MRIFLWGKATEEKSDNPPEQWGPPLWEELHKRPYQFVSRSKETDWLLDVFSPKIPCDKCRQELWKHLLAHSVPDRAHEYADWLVEFHNVVNAKLSKPRWRAPEKSLS